jgi:hypothetical protein
MRLRSEKFFSSVGHAKQSAPTSAAVVNTPTVADVLQAKTSATRVTGVQASTAPKAPAPTELQ